MSEQQNTASVSKSAVDGLVVWPAQCSCGHLYLEKYQFKKPTEEGNIGFCWCGFCRTKRMVKAI